MDKGNCKTVILMRGLPSCGKSYTSRQLAGEEGVVCELDEFFYAQVGDDPSVYNWSDDLVARAHLWNLGRFKDAVDAGNALVIVDADLPLRAWLLGVVAIPLVLACRFASVAGTIGLLRRHRTFTPHAIKIMTWGGLRGGISVALALSLPDVPARATVLAITYVVVAFSILVQGLTIERLARLIPKSD